MPRRWRRLLGTRCSGAVFIHDSLKCQPNRRMPFGVFSAFSFPSVLISLFNTLSLACTTVNATYSALSGTQGLPVWLCLFFHDANTLQFLPIPPALPRSSCSVESQNVAPVLSVTRRNAAVLPADSRKLGFMTSPQPFPVGTRLAHPQITGDPVSSPVAPNHHLFRN